MVRAAIAIAAAERAAARWPAGLIFASAVIAGQRPIVAAVVGETIAAGAAMRRVAMLAFGIVAQPPALGFLVTEPARDFVAGALEEAAPPSGRGRNIRVRNCA